MERIKSEMTKKQKRNLAIFYCRNVPDSNEDKRKALEKEHCESVRFFPLPCSGRLESIHLLRAIEDFADAAFVITCPEGACRYFEGNLRARKRVEMAGSILESIGLEKERVGIIVGSSESPKSLAEITEELLESTSGLKPSPLHETRLRAEA
jgi:F420-non-reducing hydrogenase iron-sulfur subunit